LLRCTSPELVHRFISRARSNRVELEAKRKLIWLPYEAGFRFQPRHHQALLPKHGLDSVSQIAIDEDCQRYA
jgi:hypothetical protein